MVGDQMLKYRRTQSLPLHNLLAQHGSRSPSAYLGSAVARQSVVPQSLVRTLDWHLVLMIAVSKRSGSQEGHGQDVCQHDDGDVN